MCVYVCVRVCICMYIYVYKPDPEPEARPRRPDPDPGGNALVTLTSRTIVRVSHPGFRNYRDSKYCGWFFRWYLGYNG